MFRKIKRVIATFSKKDGFKIEDFKELIEAIKTCGKTEKVKRIDQVMAYNPLTRHYTSGGFHILSESKTLQYEAHEFHTAQKLADAGFHVIFVPKGYFNRTEKRFDIFLFRKHIVFEADLKFITSDNPDTIGNRIKEGSEQANRIVIDIQSSVSKNKLIEGLKTGCSKNNQLSDIFLFYKGNFYELQKNQIMSKKIFTIIK